MLVYFLSADQPIAKSYELGPNNELLKTPYPFIYDFTSHETQPKDLQELHQLMTQHATLGNCMIKGLLHRPLVAESRAGSTDGNDPTDWICLDIDGIKNYQSIDDLLKDLGCEDISYILQWSSSMGIENKIDLRCHVIMQLNKAVHPQLLKNWLIDLNLKTQALNSQLQLTKTYNSLKWPLDITTCQNDKLIYIASPNFGAGLADPYPNSQRIQLIQKKNSLLVLPPGVPSKDNLKSRTDSRVNELRILQNLPKRKATKYKFYGTVEYMANPETAIVTETKRERGFVYFNLNGGDSWGYYHPEDNPAFIYNFKGEPTYRTEDLLPDYWAEIARRVANYEPDCRGNIYFAFRDFKTSNYYNGIYSTDSKKLDFAQAKSETQLRHFMKQHGQPLGDFIPDWSIIFDPHSELIVDPANNTINIFEPSSYMKAPKPTQQGAMPPICQKIINHALGSDPTTVEHFLNWLACIVQYLDRTGTAWILHGTEGTGKGLLFHEILTPLLGSWNVTSKRMEELESEFTGFMENKFLVFIDEIQTGRSLYHEKVNAKLKNLIVEPTISIRKMYTPAFQSRNYSNMIFASNKNEPVEVPPDDRRFNVGMYQSEPILAKVLQPYEINLISKELETMYAYLATRPANRDLARTPLVNHARSTLIKTSRSAVDSVSDALLSGNMEFFWDNLIANKDIMESNRLLASKYASYRALIIEIINGENTLSREDLFILYEWLVGKMPMSPNKFTSLLRHHNVHIQAVWKHNRTVRGLKINWQFDPAWLAGAKAEIQQGVI